MSVAFALSLFANHSQCSYEVLRDFQKGYRLLALNGKLHDGESTGLAMHLSATFLHSNLKR